MTNKANMGKWAEKEAQTWLEAKSQQDSGFAWLRFPDAHAAMGRLSAQPCDYLVSVTAGLANNRTIYLEVKETAQASRLPKAKIGQHGMLRKFFWSNAHVLVLVYMSGPKHWVMLRADRHRDDLFYHDVCPASFPLADLRPYATAAAALEEYLLCL